MSFCTSSFRRAALCRLVACLILLAVNAHAANVGVQGRVLDDNSAPVPGARITFTPLSGVPKLETTSDPTGAFSIDAVAGVEYSVRAEREGYFLVDQRIVVGDSGTELTITLPRRQQVVESVDAVYAPAALDPDRTFVQTLVTGGELIDVPYPKTNEIRNATRILPGVVPDSRGGLHFNGGAEEQALYTLDGFTINDPLTGRLETRLSVEAVRAFELRSGSLPAEYGKGSAAVFAVRTEPGADVRRVFATNFVPGIEQQKGLTIGGWTPRFGISGPLRKGRAWLSDSVDIQYTNTIVNELERGQDQSVSWRGSNLLRSQVNITESNILQGGLLTSWWNASNAGLTAVDPLETTINWRARAYFFNLKDQIAFHGGGLVEFGYAGTRNFARESPQGDGVQIFTPYGMRGNHMLNALRTGERDQLLLNGFVPSFAGGGKHQIKAGVDLNWIRYSQQARRSGYDFQRADGTVIRETRFVGPGAFHNASREMSSYIQDSWRWKPNLMIELGLRQDWDSLVRSVAIAPRLGFAWAPASSTKLLGGYAVVFEPGNLRLFSEPLDQHPVTTAYPFEDAAVERIITISRFAPNSTRFRSPRYTNWNAGVEHQFGPQLYARAGYTRRRGARGLTYVSWPALQEEYAGVRMLEIENGLANLRRDKYDAVELMIRHTFRTRYEWMVSYTRSSARSNAVTDVRVDTPFLAKDNVGPMPWDSPNRLLSWGYLPMPRWKNWAVAYLTEYRTGQPFSIQDEFGGVLGPINHLRYPAFFELNLHFERSFTALKHRWAFRFGANNLTDHKNPNVVINTLGSPQFLKFYGGQRRAFNVRIRWLGRAI